MDKYLEAEKRLAELLEWKSLRIDSMFGLVGASPTAPPGTEEVQTPRWCRDKAAAFELMVEHSIDVSFLNISLCIETYNPLCRLAHHYISNHPDKAAATRYAIVQAVIAKLEAQNDTK